MCQDKIQTRLRPWDWERKKRDHETGRYQPVGVRPTRLKPVGRPVANSARGTARKPVKHRSRKYAGCVIESRNVVTISIAYHGESLEIPSVLIDTGSATTILATDIVASI